MARPSVGIIGVGAAGFGPRASEMSARELMFEAAARAYGDAGVDPRSDVDSFITTSEDLWEGWSITDEMVPDQLGGAGRPVCTIPSDGITALGNGVMQIQSGIASVVAVEGHSKGSDIVDKEAVERFAQEPTLVRPLGMSSDTMAALEMEAFFRSSGLGLDECDLVVGESEKRARLNPLARVRPTGGARRTGSQVLSSPLRALDKAQCSDAAIVIVLASMRWAREKKRKAIGIEGIAWRSSLPWYDGGGAKNAEYVSDSFARAAKQAGLAQRLEDYGLIELDDTYSFKLLQHLASLGPARADAHKAIGGRRPAVNPSGGALAVGDLKEASALYRAYEAVLQLRGDAGRRQVAGAKRALVQSWRGVPTATGGVMILSAGGRQ
jgi:acetyl-CoA C-acetyltransferase